MLQRKLGEMEIELCGEKFTLRATRGAAVTVNAFFGNFMSAYQRLSVFDMKAFEVITAAGLGKAPNDKLDRLNITVEEAIFENGLRELGEPLGEFVTLLSNGGRSLEDKPKDASQGEA